MKLTEFVVREAIQPSLKASGKEEVIREMVSSLKASGAINPAEEEELVAAILRREELGTTGIGNGVAVPHTKHKNLPRVSAAVAISRGGVDFAAVDGEDVHIFIMVISPADRPGEHLRALEKISRHLKSQDFCNFLRQSATTADIWDLLVEADEGDRDT